jgi:hypothetical protein
VSFTSVPLPDSALPLSLSSLVSSGVRVFIVLSASTTQIGRVLDALYVMKLYGDSFVLIITPVQVLDLLDDKTVTQAQRTQRLEVLQVTRRCAKQAEVSVRTWRCVCVCVCVCVCNFEYKEPI